MNPRVLACGLIFIAIFAVLTPVVAAQSTEEDHLWRAVNSIDSSIRAVKLGRTQDARAALGGARTHYENFRFKVQEAAQELDNRVMQAFNSMLAAAPEDFRVENLKALRADVLSAAGAAGIWLSPLYHHPALVIAAAAAILALLVTLVSKRVIDWPRLKQAKEEQKALAKEILAATRKGDAKQIHKLQPRYRQLSGEVMRAMPKQMFLSLIPFFIAWPVLEMIYSGWIVVWLPFGPIDLLFWTDVVSVGFFWWFILTHSGFSVIWRLLLIGEWG